MPNQLYKRILRFRNSNILLQIMLYRKIKMTILDSLFIAISAQIGNCFVHVHKYKGLHIRIFPVSI